MPLKVWGGGVHLQQVEVHLGGGGRGGRGGEGEEGGGRGEGGRGGEGGGGWCDRGATGRGD